MAANERLHLVLCRLDGSSQILGTPIQGNSAAVERMKVCQLIDEKGGVQRGRLDTAKHPRVLGGLFTQPGSSGTENDGQRILDVVGNGGENRGTLRAQFALAPCELLRLQLLLTLCRDEQTDRNRNRAEDHLILPLLEGGQSS